MSINPRRQKHLKRKISFYILFLGVLGGFFFLVNILITSGKPLYISPIGKINTDLTRVEKILKDNNISFSSVTLLDDSYLINVSNSGQIRLSQKKDAGRQISSLQRILVQLTIEGKPFKGIDFRFSEPIISF